MSKWEISEAAEKRITKRIAEHVAEERFGTNAGHAIKLAIEPENFARPDRVVEDLVKRWIRDSDLSLLRTIAANYFAEMMHDNREMRAACRRFSSAVSTFHEYSGGES
jgi:hypothetical protein